jgi:glutaminase
MDRNRNVSASFKPIPFVATTTGVTDGVIVAPAATVTTTASINGSDVGKTGSVFITGWIPGSALGVIVPAAAMGSLDTLTVKHANGVIEPLSMEALGATTDAFVLVQLTPTGWQAVVNGQLIPYTTGTLSEQTAALSILNNTDTSRLDGAQLCIGYGTGDTGTASAAEMIQSGRMQLIATVATGTTSVASTGSCLVSDGALVSQFASRATVSASKTVYGAFVLVNPTNLYIAVRGPSLGTLGVSNNALARPQLSLYDGTATLVASSNQCAGATPDNAAVASYYRQTRNAPLDANDACLGYATNTLAAGTYTFLVVPEASAASGSGEVLFETTPIGDGALLKQFASRATLTSASTVYGAFVLVNPTHLYIAVRGPSLGTLGVSPTPHPHPQLNLFDGAGTLLTSSNQCSGATADNAAVVNYYRQTRNAPLDANDACLGFASTALPAGIYTFQVVTDSSVPAGSGEILFETTPVQ